MASRDRSQHLGLGNAPNPKIDSEVQQFKKHSSTSPHLPYLLIDFVNSAKAPVDLTDLTIIDTPAIHLPYAILLTIGTMVPIRRDTMDGVKAALRISFPALL